MTRIEAIRRRAEAATKGPWKAGPPAWRKRNGRYRCPINSPSGSVATTFVDGVYRCADFREGNVPPPSDGVFIAHARSDVPWLLARVEEMERALKQMVEETKGRVGPDGMWNLLPPSCVAYSMAQDALAALEEEN